MKRDRPIGKEDIDEAFGGDDDGHRRERFVGKHKKELREKAVA